MKIRIEMLVTAVVCACVLPMAAHAISLTFADALGTIVNGEPANATDETAYVNSLVTRANGVSSAPYDVIGKTYTLITDPAETLPLAVYDNKIENDLNSFDASGYLYMLVKYDGPNGADVVWYLGGLSAADLASVVIPDKFPKNDDPDKSVGISHRTFFNKTNLPDGGATIALLGVALVGVYVVRRRISKV